MQIYADLEVEEGEKSEKNNDGPTPKDPETEQHQGDEPDSEETQLA